MRLLRYIVRNRAYDEWAKGVSEALRADAAQPFDAKRRLFESDLAYRNRFMAWLRANVPGASDALIAR
jgi:hypothetical protein